VVIFGYSGLVQYRSITQIRLIYIVCDYLCWADVLSGTVSRSFLDLTSRAGTGSILIGSKSFAR
jgi:hypothetical protein